MFFLYHLSLLLRASPSHPQSQPYTQTDTSIHMPYALLNNHKEETKNNRETRGWVVKTRGGLFGISLSDRPTTVDIGE